MNVATATGASGGRRAYRTAYDAILDSIHTGIYQPGSRIPSERVLVEQLGLSRVTVRQALTKLAEDGFLTSSAQRGWFVRDSKVVGEPPSQLQSFSDMVRDRGLTPSSRILAFDERPASFAEAEALALAPSAPVLAVRRLRFMDDVPVCIDSSVVALGRAPGMSNIDLTGRSLYATLEEVSGVRIVRSDYEVHAEAAEPHDAKSLRIQPGGPVLIGEEIAFDQNGNPVLSGRIVYRADAYRFRATLFRPAL